MKQNIFGRLVAVAAVLLLSAATASAHSFEVNGIYYNIHSDGTSVGVTYKGESIYHNDYSGAVTIPASVTYSGETYSVTSIGYRAFYGCSGLEKVEISDLEAWCKISFEDAEANPIYYSHNLFLNGQEIKNLIIPETVQELKSYVFYDCDGLTSVVIPNSVTSIGIEAFRYCI